MAIYYRISVDKVDRCEHDDMLTYTYKFFVILSLQTNFQK